MRTRNLFAPLLAVLALAACDETPTDLGECTAVVEQPTVVETRGDTVVTSSGLRYIVETTGTGTTATPCSAVAVHYEGFLTNDFKFDSSRDRGERFLFELASGTLITGFEQGVLGMRVGEVRRLIIPSELGYGAAGRSPIPPNATLIFDIELLDVRN